MRAIKRISAVTGFQRMPRAMAAWQLTWASRITSSTDWAFPNLAKNRRICRYVNWSVEAGARRVPTRLPGHVRDLDRSAGRARRALLCGAKPPHHAGLAVRQGAPLPGARLSSRPTDASLAPRGTEGQRLLGTNLLGGSHRGDYEPLERDHCPLRRGGDLALFLQRHAGPAPVSHLQ